jgi:hypothetical protein
MAQAKPDLSNGVWGSTGSTTDPGAVKTKTGWIAEIPPSGVQNWAQKRSDEFIAHVNEQGIAIHDTATDYPVNGWAKGSDGQVYVSLQTPNINQDPTTEAAYWAVLSTGFGSNENPQGGAYLLAAVDYSNNKTIVYTGAGGDTFTHLTSASLTAQAAVFIEHRGTGILEVDLANASDRLGTLSLGRTNIFLSPGEKVRFVLTGTANVWNVS